jgi:hypothetical protein
VQLAKELLNRDLIQYGLKVDNVVVRYFRYTDEIQKNIEEKKLKDQLVFKNQAGAERPPKAPSSTASCTSAPAPVAFHLEARLSGRRRIASLAFFLAPTLSLATHWPLLSHFTTCLQTRQRLPASRMPHSPTTSRETLG